MAQPQRDSLVLQNHAPSRGLQMSRKQSFDQLVGSGGDPRVMADQTPQTTDTTNTTNTTNTTDTTASAGQFMRMAAARARDKMHRIFEEERRWDPIPVITLDG
uniref:Peroxisomal membrane protein PEX31 n=1 Tax=Steinernema glaseri TaxID=37863 RepID=A0A1I7YU40_9BILA